MQKRRLRRTIFQSCPSAPSFFCYVPPPPPPPPPPSPPHPPPPSLLPSSPLAVGTEPEEPVRFCSLSFLLLLLLFSFHKCVLIYLFPPYRFATILDWKFFDNQARSISLKECFISMWFYFKITLIISNCGIDSLLQISHSPLSFWSVDRFFNEPQTLPIFPAFLIFPHEKLKIIQQYDFPIIWVSHLFLM